MSVSLWHAVWSREVEVQDCPGHFLHNADHFPQWLIRGHTGGGVGAGLEPLPPLLGNLVHTFDLYGRTHSRKRNTNKTVTFVKLLMHSQPAKGLKFHQFSGGACPQTPSSRLLTCCRSAPTLYNTLHGPCWYPTFGQTSRVYLPCHDTIRTVPNCNIIYSIHVHEDKVELIIGIFSFTRMKSCIFFGWDDWRSSN